MRGNSKELFVIKQMVAAFAARAVFLSIGPRGLKAPKIQAAAAVKKPKEAFHKDNSLKNRPKNVKAVGINARKDSGGKKTASVSDCGKAGPY